MVDARLGELSGGIELWSHSRNLFCWWGTIPYLIVQNVNGVGMGTVWVRYGTYLWLACPEHFIDPLRGSSLMGPTKERSFLL